MPRPRTPDCERGRANFGAEVAVRAPASSPFATPPPRRPESAGTFAAEVVTTVTGPGASFGAEVWPASPTASHFDAPPRRSEFAGAFAAEVVAIVAAQARPSAPKFRPLPPRPFRRCAARVGGASIGYTWFMAITQLVSEARLRAGLTQAELAQAELARRAGVAKSTVGRIEARLRAPSTELVERLVRAAGFEIRVGLGAPDPATDAMFERTLRRTPAERLADATRAARFALQARRALDAAKRSGD